MKNRIISQFESFVFYIFNEHIKEKINMPLPKKETFATDFVKHKIYTIKLINGYEHQLKIILN